MKIKYFCPLWGSESLNFGDFCAKVKDAGYYGVEMSFPMDRNKKEEILKIIAGHGLEHIAQHWETITSDFKDHKTQFKERLANLASTDPIFINSHTGKDYFSFEQNLELIGLSDEISKVTGMEIYHETHRSRFAFAAHVTRHFIREIPDLKLSADFSHWCCVAESELDDQHEALNLAIERSFHIHARVGFPGGPQVSDPRLPEWEKITKKHLDWWQRIKKAREKDGLDELSVTSEFGPFPYMQRIPFTLAALANQWEINVYMKDLLMKEFQF